MSIKGIRYLENVLNCHIVKFKIDRDEMESIKTSLLSAVTLLVVSVSSMSAAASSTSTIIQTTSRSTSPPRNSAVGEDTPLDVSVQVFVCVCVRTVRMFNRILGKHGGFEVTVMLP